MNSKKTTTLAVFAILMLSGRGFAQEERLNSPLTAQVFYNVGYELYTAKEADFNSAKQAMMFFNAAVNLDSRANYVLPDIINIAWQYPDRNFSDTVALALRQYVGRTSDLEVTSKAVGYLLERLDSREQREELLKKLLYNLGNNNQAFSSDLFTQLAFLRVETADVNSAQEYFMRAFYANKYNNAAFTKLAELTEAGGGALPEAMYLHNLRFRVAVNPLDVDSAYSFAQYARALSLYEAASEGYRYCMEALKYLNRDDSVSVEFYRPWMMSSYNARQYERCRGIVGKIRKKNIFDVQIEAIASAAALQNGDKKTLEETLDRIELRSKEILSGNLDASATELADYAWFFSFIADVNSDEILTWATKAYNADQNSVDAASYFAYALVKNDQYEVAEALLEKIGATTQAAQIAQAEILLQKQDNASAIELLKSIVSRLPGSFEASKAKGILKAQGVEYQPVFDAAVFTASLKAEFGPSIFPNFVKPDEMLELEFDIKGTAFSYGSEIAGNLTIINKYSDPIMICPEGILKGNIRIDVKVGGDLTAQIPAIISKTIRPSDEIEPGNALFIPVRLDTGKLKCMLDCHPQAELNLEYTAYIDPVETTDGQITNAVGIKPVRVVLTRRKLDLNTRYMQQRLDALKKGHQGQKAKSAELFAGLLAEQQKFRQTGPAYRFMYVEPDILSSAIAKCLTSDDWILKVQTMASMLRLKPDYRLTEAISGELRNSYWPVRLMAVFTLARSEDEQFLPVLKWTAQTDPNPVVKALAGVFMNDTGPASGQSGIQVDKNTDK